MNFPPIVTSPQALESMSGALHDWWLDLDSLEVHEDGQSISILILKPIRANRARSGDWKPAPGTAVRATVRSVIGFRVEDTEEIAQYPIRDIVFDEASCTLSVQSGIPMRCEIRVAKLHVDVVTI